VSVVARRALAAVIVGVVLTCVAVGVFRGVTEPNGSLWGMSNRTADLWACWTLFLFLPLVCALDAARIDQATWWRAHRSKAAWIALIAYLPVIGPLAYAALGRP
jgi:hypothetical protein